jgi:uncharacterized protein (DUF885 family)
MLKPFLALVAFTLTAPAVASPSTDLKAVIDAHWAWVMINSPEYASSLGEHGGDGKLSDISLAAADRAAKDAQGFRARLAAVPDAGLSETERTDKAILTRMLSEQIEGNKFGARMMLFSTYAGWHQNFVGLADNSPFNTAADYESYLKRLRGYPALNAEALKITRAAVAGGFVQPCVVLTGFEGSITGVIAPKVEGSGQSPNGNDSG